MLISDAGAAAVSEREEPGGDFDWGSRSGLRQEVVIYALQKPWNIQMGCSLMGFTIFGHGPLQTLFCLLLYEKILPLSEKSCTKKKRKSLQK